MRRIILLVAAVVVLVGLAIGVYFLFFNQSPSISVAPGGPGTLPTSGANTSTTSEPPAASTTPTTVSSRLVRISAGPVVPAVSATDVPSTTASSSDQAIIRYIDRQSGNIYAYNATSGINTRTSNKTIPGVEQAFWLPNGLTAYLQYLSGTDFSTINTYAITATGTEGFFLPQNLADISVSSNGLLELASGTNGSVGSVTRSDGSKSVQAFTTPLTSIRAAIAGKNSYLVYTRPAAALDGYAYMVKNGTFETIAGPLPGLTALSSHSGEWVLVSSVTASGLAMELVNTNTHEALPLPIATIADKCVWTEDDSALYCGIPTVLDQNATYPDDWYQGATAFNDRIWKIDVAGRFSQLVLDFTSETSGTTSGTSPLDATALAVDPDSSVLSFVNKNDESLWVYKL